MKVPPIVLFCICYCASLRTCFSFSPRLPTVISNNPIGKFPSCLVEKSTATIKYMTNKDEDGDNNASMLQMESEDIKDTNRRNMIYNSIAVGLLGVSGVASWSLFQTSVYTPSGFQRLPNTQFIAALGDPKASQGTGDAKSWGLWRVDPGPRGVWLRDYQSSIVQNKYQAPAGWSYNPNDWWLEEHGLIMEAPAFPIPPGRYLVTGGRMVTTGLTIDADGNWKLDDGTLYDVTHLPCRSARYSPVTNDDDNNSSVQGSPLTANQRDFPVTPGAEMPNVPGCKKQDYAVLFLVGKEISKKTA